MRGHSWSYVCLSRSLVMLVRMMLTCELTTANYSVKQCEVTAGPMFVCESVVSNVGEDDVNL